jgi:pectate lyase
VLVLALAVSAAPALAMPAFPGAEGYGSGATGGRGGAVVYVEHLSDAFPSEPLYAGSLRKALEGTTGRRTVVFRTGGVIRLKAGIRILPGHGDVTIAGQSAPGEGIGLMRIDNDPVSNISQNLLRIEANNVILRHVRLRPAFFGGVEGPCTNCERKATALGIRNGAQSVIVDHASMSWGNDASVELEGGTVDGLPTGAPARVRNVTIQWSIISEGTTLDPVLDPTQGLAAFEGVDRVSIHHTLFAHNQIRNPEITSGSNWEFINNVLYDAPIAASELYDRISTVPVEVDYIGNYAALPGDPATGPKQLRIFKWGDEGSPVGFSLFLDGNIGPSRPGDGSQDSLILQCRVLPCAGCAGQPCSAPYPKAWLRTAPGQSYPPNLRPVTVDYNPAFRALWTNGLHDRVGATLPQRDRVDDCIVYHVDTWTGSVIRGLSKGCAADGFTLATGLPVADRDADGMPDSYEAQHATILDPDDASDGPQDPDGDCYTNLEEYLNGTPPQVRDAGSIVVPAFVSIAAEDGQLLEDPGSGLGAAALTARQTLKIGDDATDAERRAILSFDTSSLPDTATICSAVIELSPAGSVGAPAGLGAIAAVAPPVRGASFGGEPLLEPSDFQATSTSSRGTLVERPAFFEARVKPSSVAVVGRSQYRLQVPADDGDGAEDSFFFYSGDAATAALRPTLTVTYQP